MWALAAGLAAAPGEAQASWIEGPAGALRVFFEDAWYVASSPARMNRESLAWTAGFVAAGAVIYANDQEILDAIQRSRDDDVLKALVWLGDRWEPVGHMGKTNKYYLGALAVGLATRYEPLERVPAEILQSHLTAGALRNLGKVAVGRRRPFEGEGPDAFAPPDGTSFPSGHASVVFELAAIAAHETRDTPFSIPVSTVAHFAAGSVSLQRLTSESHWPSDVYAAAISGALISRTLLARRDARYAAEAAEEAARPPRAEVRLTPTFSRSQGFGARLDVNF